MAQPQGPLTHRTYADGTIVPVKATRRRNPHEQEGPNYVMLDVYALAKAPMIFNRTEQRILAIIVSEYRLGEPYCLLSQSDIARRCGISRQNCSRAMKTLMEDGWVGRISDRCWTVSPYFGWRGSRSEWATARRTTNTPNWRGHDMDREWLDEAADDIVNEATGEVR